MATKTAFSKVELTRILSQYNLGEHETSKPIATGAVQTNLLLYTTLGKFVLRLYENRSKDSVLFEIHLLKFLRAKHFPCPTPLSNTRGSFVNIYHQKPYVIFEFVEGRHLDHPSEDQRKQLIEKVAELHLVTRQYRSLNKRHRWNYSPDLCRALARRKAGGLGTANAREKLKWLERELLTLRLPTSLPKGICHGDFHFSNVLYKNGRFNGLIDFDDANYTFLLFDLVGLIEYEAWDGVKDKRLNFDKARKVVSEYTKHRSLAQVEKNHFFDVYKLSILIDSVWYFGRGEARDFFERRKIEYLNVVGREEFSKRLFGLTTGNHKS